MANINFPRSAIRQTGWIGAGRDFYQVKTGLLGTVERLVDGHDTYLLAFLIDDADLEDADLAIGAWAGRNRRT